MDAFHTLAADRLIEATADNRNLIPFTWAICRLFNALILITGVSVLMLRDPKTANPKVIVMFSVFFGVLAYGIIQYCATSDRLPQTMFPDSLITRPWDVGPLLLFIFAGLYVFPRFYKKKPSIFSHALIYCCVPEAAVELHMAFGSTSLFDNHFNIAHFLKIFAYVVPFLGLLLEYVKTYQQEQESVKNLEETKKELIQSEKEIGAVVENVVDGIISINDQGIIEKFNTSAQKIFGYTSQEAVGANITLIIPESYRSQHTQGMQVFRDTGQAKILGQTLNLEDLHKNGTVFPLELAVNKLELEDRVLFVGIVRDISERKQSEEQILKAKNDAEVAREEAEKANLAKSLFLANMSHEIRTPMNAVLGYSQILMRKKDLDKDTKIAIKTIDSSGKNLLKMINEILDMSKIEAGKMELNSIEFDLQVVIDNLRSMFDLRCKQKQINLKIKGFSKATPVYGDENKLRQILTNLLSNAVKFTESGVVTFKVTPLENDQYRFDIFDTGHGITVEAQKHIFEPFYQEEKKIKSGGTGLGLAISQKQVQLMGSDLLLESEIGDGSHFYFTLTLPPAEEAVTHKRKTSAVLHLLPEHKVKALVVDDVKENRDVLAKLLSSIGDEIIEAEDGKEGVEKTKEHQPDIVFMDMRMPVMRGEDAIKLIQKEFGKDRIKIVAITASAFDRRRDHYLEMGCHEYISKPFKEEEVFNCLKVLLDVEFVYEDDEVSQEESSTIEELDLSQISIPEDLYEKLKESAKLYNISGLENALEELSQSDGTSTQLQEHLLQLTNKYDMKAIIEVLESVSKTRD